MFQVDLYARIRLAHRDGLSIRAIAKQLGCSRQVVRKALVHPEPPPFQTPQPRPAPKLGPFQTLIDQILADDHKAPPKQRHTAQRLFERLVAEHGYTGGYDQVRRYVHKHHVAQQELFVPLSYAPGSRAECDFGHVAVDFPDGRRSVPVLLVTWAYSHCPFAMAVPSEKTEAILHGMVAAFDFFGCVPREVWWDNPTTVASEIFAGRQRRLHPRYQALASHYNFEPLFCLPRHGQEKSHAENRVKRLQRTWATPVPRVVDLAQWNQILRQHCEAERARSVQRTEQSIGERFEQERQHALALPRFPFDPCVVRPALVDKYQTVHFETNWYSVPRPLAFQKVTVKAYVERIEVVQGDQVMARHPRSYGRHAQVLDPLHYLVTLSRKPAVLDHAEVYRTWELPEPFAKLRQRLQDQHGSRTGTRHYIRVLQLLAQHSAERVSQAIAVVLARGHADATAIAEYTQRLARDTPRPGCADSADGHGSVTRDTALTMSALRAFDQLLSHARVCGDEGVERTS